MSRTSQIEKLKQIQPRELIAAVPPELKIQYSQTQLLNEADKALYTAKNSAGKDKVGMLK